MKILLISSGFNKHGGISRYVAELAERSVKEHETHLPTTKYDYKVANLIVHKKPMIEKPFWLQNGVVEIMVENIKIFVKYSLTMKGKELSIKELKRVCQESKEGWEHRNWFDKNITRKISIYITYIAIRFGISPNQITIATLFVGIIGGMLIATGNKIYWVTGFLIVYLGVILDAVDGELARYYNMTTELGKYLDLFVGLFLHKFILACIALALYLETNNVLSLILGVVSISAISLSAENMLYMDCATNKLKLIPAKSDIKNKSRILLNTVEEHVLRSLFDYCYGFSIFWACIGIIDVIASINVKLPIFEIYTLLVVVGCFKNNISSVKLLSSFSK